jgi:hypothetical protein
MELARRRKGWELRVSSMHTGNRLEAKKRQLCSGLDGPLIMFFAKADNSVHLLLENTAGQELKSDDYSHFQNNISSGQKSGSNRGLSGHGACFLGWV